MARFRVQFRVFNGDPSHRHARRRDASNIGARVVSQRSIRRADHEVISQRGQIGDPFEISNSPFDLGAAQKGFAKRNWWSLEHQYGYLSRVIFTRCDCKWPNRGPLHRGVLRDNYKEDSESRWNGANPEIWEASAKVTT
jgi:hypothetical protein